MGSPEGNAVDRLSPRFAAPAGEPRAVGPDAAAVARAAGIQPRLDRGMALAFLRDGEFDVRRTFFDGVALLEPLAPVAHGPTGAILVGLPPAAPSLGHAAGPESSARAVRATVDAAVERAVSPARRVAVALSGGLDSSVVAASAAAAWRRLGRPAGDLRFYHLQPPAGPDEVAHAAAVARHVGRELTVVAAVDGDPFAGEDALLGARDFPSDGGGGGPWAAFGERLRADGIERILTGDGGDEAFADEPPTTRGVRAIAAALRGRLRPRRWRDAPASGPAWLLNRGRDVPPVVAAPAPRPGLVGPPARRDASMRSGRQTATLGWWRGFDRIYGTRTEDPLLDPQVQDVVLALRPEDLLGPVGRKALLRRAYADTLPAAQRDRPKDQPLYEPLFRRDFARHAEAWTERFLRGGPLEREGVVTTAEAREVFSRGASGSLADLSLALRLLGLAAWSKRRGL